jgi:hypothetical protein
MVEILQLNGWRSSSLGKPNYYWWIFQPVFPIFFPCGPKKIKGCTQKMRYPQNLMVTGITMFWNANDYML